MVIFPHLLGYKDRIRCDKFCEVHSRCLEGITLTLEETEERGDFYYKKFSFLWEWNRPPLEIIKGTE